MIQVYDTQDSKATPALHLGLHYAYLESCWVSHLRQLILPFAAARWTGVTPFWARSTTLHPSDSTSQTTTDRWPNREAAYTHRMCVLFCSLGRHVQWYVTINSCGIFGKAYVAKRFTNTKPAIIWWSSVVVEWYDVQPGHESTKLQTKRKSCSMHVSGAGR